MPGQKDLKLLVPRDATAGWALFAARQRWFKQMEASDGLFMFCGNRMCSATTRIQTIDLNQPDEVIFDVRKESTFG